MLISIETYIKCNCAAAQTIFIVELADSIYIKYYENLLVKYRRIHISACSDYCISCPCLSFRLSYR